MYTPFTINFNFSDSYFYNQGFNTLTVRNVIEANPLFIDPTSPSGLRCFMAFYNSTNGAGWTNNTGWIDGASGTNCDPCSGWHGVTCVSGRLTELLLNSK